MDILGQEKLVSKIINIKNAKKIASAYIIDGNIDSETESIARLFVMSVNCQNLSSEGPCGVCINCQKILHNNNPNIMYITPDGASIKILQIRQIINEVAKKANDIGEKIVILKEAHSMTIDAQNAFLKTLEEPPDNTIFLLLTTQIDKLLTTVRSRCQRLKLEIVSNTEIIKYLQARYTDDKKIHHAAIVADGSVSMAMKIMDNTDYFENRKVYEELLVLIDKKEVLETSKQVEKIVRSRDLAQDIVYFLLSYYRDILINKEMGDMSQALLRNIDMIKQIEKATFTLTSNQINSIIDKVLKTIKEIEQNVNYINCVDNLLFGIMEVKNG